MGNKNLKIDPNYFIKDYTYLNSHEKTKYGNFAIYKKLKSELELKVVKHFPFKSDLKGKDSDIIYLQKIADNIGSNPAFFKMNNINEPEFIRALFEGGSLLVSDLLGQWSEQESLNLLFFLAKACKNLEESRFSYPYMSPEQVFITEKGIKLNHPFLFDGYTDEILKVIFTIFIVEI